MASDSTNSLRFRLGYTLAALTAACEIVPDATVTLDTWADESHVALSAIIGEAFRARCLLKERAIALTLETARVLS